LVIGFLELITAVFFVLEFQHGIAHPLLYDIRIFIRFKKQVDGQFKFAGDQDFLLASSASTFVFLSMVYYFLDL
jgi:hypothetical protein